MDRAYFAFQSNVQDMLARAAGKYSQLQLVHLAELFGITLFAFAEKHHPEKLAELKTALAEPDPAALKPDYSASLEQAEKALFAHFWLSRRFDAYLLEVYRTRGAVDLRDPEALNREMEAA